MRVEGTFIFPLPSPLPKGRGGRMGGRNNSLTFPDEAPQRLPLPSGRGAEWGSQQPPYFSRRGTAITPSPFRERVGERATPTPGNGFVSLSQFVYNGPLVCPASVALVPSTFRTAAALRGRVSLCSPSASRRFRRGVRCGARRQDSFVKSLGMSGLAVKIPLRGSRPGPLLQWPLCHPG